MPKEEPRLSEDSPCATASKNARDKLNSAPLLVLCDAKDTSSRRVSHCNSEKDSGYSDAGSDWQQTDAEDQQSTKSQHRIGDTVGASQPYQNQVLQEGCPGNSTLMPQSPQNPPFYVLKKMVLKQPDTIQKRRQMLWGNGSRDTHGSAATQTVLLPASTQLHRPLYQKTHVTGKTINSTRLPVLNSYPHIAPQPTKKLPDRFSLNSESQNLSVSLEPKNNDACMTRRGPEQHLHKHPKLEISSPNPCLPSDKDGLSSSSATAVSSNVGSSFTSASTVYSTPSVHKTRGLYRNSLTSIHHRRFLNTVKILRQSGLLDITLRTKELQRQNSATERDIVQLRLHTELLCRAANCSSDNPNNITAWQNIHEAMAHSGSYPNLKILKVLQTHSHSGSVSQPNSISAENINVTFAAENSNMPPYCLLTASRNPGQFPSEEGRVDNQASGKVTFMPPDSSTSSDSI
ncbi:CLOCK-interacting pacemaker [Thalassophryne amazonica]|uniref:CLOCK-interacting pacemaker n=1 Tax=Thalassophryne amazonica TaxID=390379 RepID=UPI001470CE90|nr:CLOCK-interacting pacemaker [Thalassophryne amazonica]